MLSHLRGLALRALTILRVAAVLVLAGLSAGLLVGLVPSLLGAESFVVSDSRMQPQLQTGDVAVVSAVPVEALSAWDVISYRSPADPETVITRRVVYLDADSRGSIVAQVRGDAEPAAEQVRLASHASIGRLMYSVPRIGVLVSFANQTPGRLLLLGLPALLLGLDALRSRLRRQRPGLRHAPLLNAGRRALRAGYPDLALRAANAVLAIDSESRAAWLLLMEARRASASVQEVGRRHATA